MSSQLYNRRRFLAASSAGAVGGVLGASVSLQAAPVGRTNHFLYRLATEGPSIDTQRDHRAFDLRDQHRVSGCRTSRGLRIGSRERALTLEDRRQKPGNRCAKPDLPGLFIQRLLDQRGLCKIRIQHGRNGVAGFAIKAQRHGFEIQPERPVVEVHRAHCGNAIIDDKHLLMKKATSVSEDLHASCAQVVKVGKRRQPRGVMVNYAGEEDAHLYTPHGRILERGDHVLIGHKIG